MRLKLRLAAAAFSLILMPTAAAMAAPCTEPGSIKRVSKTSAGNFEYIVFEYVRPPLPTYTVLSATRPFAMDGSGDSVSVSGNYFKTVRFQGVVWTCTIVENLSGKTTAIRAVKSLGQFEGTVEYVIGYRRRSQYVSTYFLDVGKVRKIFVKFRK